MNKSTVNRILSQLLILSMVLDILPLNFVSVFAQETQQPELAQTEPAPAEEGSDDDGWTTVMTSQPYQAPDSYTVTFVQDNGESQGEHIQRGSSVGPLPEAAAIPGASFRGWFVGETAIDSAFIPESDVTAQARYASTDTAVFNLSTSNETATVHLIAADPNKANLPANARITTDWQTFDTAAPETPVTVEAEAVPLTREIFGMTLGLTDKYWTFDGNFRVSVVLNSLADPALGPDETLMLTDSAGEEIPADFWFSEEEETKGQLWKIEFTDDSLGDYRILGVTAPKVIREYTVEFLVSGEQNGPETLTLEKRAVREDEALGELPEAPAWDTDEFRFSAWLDGNGEPVSAETIVKADMAVTAAYAPVFRGSADNGVSAVIEAPLGALPEGAVFAVNAVDGELYRKDIEEQTGKTYAFLQAVDMGFSLDGEKVQPEAPVTVTLNVTGVENSDTIRVWHVAEDGSIESVPLTVESENVAEDMPASTDAAEPAPLLRSPMLKSRGLPAAPVTTVSFQAEGFSPFLLTAGGVDSTTSDDLSDFLASVIIVERNGVSTTLNAAQPGDTVKLRFVFDENAIEGLSILREEGKELRYKLPDNFGIDDNYQIPPVNVDVNYLGDPKTIMENVVEYDRDSNELVFHWNYTEENSDWIKDAIGVQIKIEVYGTIQQTPLEFNDNISIQPPSNPGVKKDVNMSDYDAANHTLKFAVRVDASDGNIPLDYPITVKDTLGAAYTLKPDTVTTVYSHDPFFTLPTGGSEPTVSVVNYDREHNSFTFNINHMYEGDALLITYTVDVDLTKVPVLGMVCDETNNVVKLLGPESQSYSEFNPGDDPANDIAVVEPEMDISDLVKSAGEVKKSSENDNEYADVPWTIVINSKRELSLGGEMITDTMTYDHNSFTKQPIPLGDMKITVTNPEGKTERTNTFSNWGNNSNLAVTNDSDAGTLSWSYRIPDSDKNKKFTYTITYTTRFDITTLTSGTLVINEASAKSGRDSATVEIARDGNKSVKIQKNSVNVNPQTVTWEIVLKADATGYNNCLITDSLPYKWASSAFRKDTLAEGDNQGYNIQIDGLYDEESYQISYHTDNREYDVLKIRFFRDQAQTDPGLLPAMENDSNVSSDEGTEWEYRKITITLVTVNNPVLLDLENPTESQMVHVNNVNARTSGGYAEASANAMPIKPALIKEARNNGKNYYPNLAAITPNPQYIVRDGVEYPIFAFRLAVGGISDALLEQNDGNIVIEDVFDVDYPELWEVFYQNNGWDNVISPPIGNTTSNFGRLGWLNPRLYVHSRPWYPSTSEGAYFLHRWDQTSLYTDEQKALLPGQPQDLNDPTRSNLLVDHNEPGKVTFTITNPPKKGEGYWDTYQILYHIVPKNKEAIEKLKRLAATSPGGVLKLHNTVTWDVADLSKTSEYYYENTKMLTKELVSRSGNWATYRIVVNPDGMWLNHGENLTLEDEYTNQSLDYKSIRVSAAGASWEYRGNKGTFSLPDGMPVVITYRARIIGVENQTITFTNTATLTPGGYQATAGGQYTLYPNTASGTGTAGVYGLDLFKYEENHMESGLQGAKFRLLDANKRPILDKNGQEIVFETGANGHVWVKLSMDEHGVAIRPNIQYYLEETEPLVVGDTHYQKDSTFYGFVIKANPNYDNYEYYNGDTLKVRNYREDKGLTISKRFSGNYAEKLTAEQKKDLTFTLQKFDDEHNWVDCGHTYTYGEFSSGSKRIENLEPGKYRVTESNAVIDGIEPIPTWQVSVVENNVPSVQNTNEFTVINKDFSIDVLVTNDYSLHQLEIKKINSAGDVLQGAQFGVFYNEGAAAKYLGGEHKGEAITYTTGSDGKFLITWDEARFTKDKLYYVTETSAPEGYILPETPEKFYFYFSDPESGSTISMPNGIKAVDLTTSYDSAVVENDFATIDIPVIKTWGVNGDEPWPEEVRSVTIALLRKDNDDGYTEYGAEGTPLTITLDKENTTGLFKNLVVKEVVENVVHKYQYKVQENKITSSAEGGDLTTQYTSNVTVSDSGWHVVNNVPNTQSLTVKKVWDASVPANHPTEVTVTLMAGSTSYSTQNSNVTLKADNDWTYTVNDVPTHDNNGDQIEYAWVENPISGYTANYDVNGSVTTITNSYTGNAERITIKGQKVWTGENGDPTNRPGSIRINLLADGTEVDTLTLSGTGDTWNWQFANRPKYNDNGVLITYTVEEDAVLNYTSSPASKPNEDDPYTFTITNTYSPAVVSVSGTKTWIDGVIPDLDNPRPPSITVKLYSDGNGKDSKNVSLDEVTGKWSYEFMNLPEYKVENGTAKKIKYTVAEDIVPDYYISNVYGHNITNTQVFDLTVQKVWNDSENAYHTRPEQIEVQLWADNVYTGKSLMLKADTDPEKSWRGTIQSLPVFKSSGDRINYTWKEIGVPPVYEAPEIVYGTAEKSTLTLDGRQDTITNELKTVTLTVKKEWDDQEDQDGKRPAGVYVNLKGEKQQLQLNEGNNWTASVVRLKRDSAGKEIDYINDVTWNEKKPTGYDLLEPVITANDDESIITTILKNQHIPSTVNLAVKKVWDDADNQDGIQPDSIEVTLYKQLSPDGPREKVESVTLKADEDLEKNWITVLKNKPVFEKGEQIIYSWAEDSMPQDYDLTDDVTTETTEAGIKTRQTTLTNSHTPETQTLRVKKEWNDLNNVDGLRSDETTIEVTLYKQEEGSENRSVVATKTLSADNNWMAEVPNLYVNAKGKPIIYTWVEDTILQDYRYEVSTADPVTENGVAVVTTTIKNIHDPYTTDLTIVKKWDDGDNQDGIRPQALSVTLSKKASGVVSVVKTITLNEANNWTTTEKVPVNENGSPITYSWSEAAVGGYELTETKVEDNVTTLTNTHKPLTTSASGSKYWSDDNDRDGIRPESVTVQLLANGIPVEGKTATVGEAENWTWKFDDLPMYKDRVQITYTISELPSDEYTALYDGMNVTNYHQPAVRPAPSEPDEPEPDDPGDPVTTPVPSYPVYVPPARTQAPTPDPTQTVTPVPRTRITPTPAPTEDPENPGEPAPAVVPTDVPLTVPTPEPREPQPVMKSGEQPYHMSHGQIEEYIAHISEIYKFKLPTIIIDDLGTPLGLGAVFINMGDCLE